MLTSIVEISTIFWENHTYDVLRCVFLDDYDGWTLLKQNITIDVILGYSPECTFVISIISGSSALGFSFISVK